MSLRNAIKRENSLREIAIEEDLEVRCNKLLWFLKKKFIAGTILSTITLLLVVVIKAGAYQLITIKMPFFQVLLIAYFIVSIVFLLVSLIIRKIKQNSEKHFYRIAYFYDLYNFFMECVCFLMLFITYVFGFVSVSGTSMKPTYNNRDILIVRTVGYQPKVNDSVIVYMGNVLNVDELYVKRIVATPGDTVKAVVREDVLNEFRYDIYVNDTLIQEKTYWNYKENLIGDLTLTITLKNDEYFIMGDNREGHNSYDSRAFGVVSRKDIIAKVISNILFWR